MILKPYSKKRLRIINFLFKLSFVKKDIKELSKIYLKEIFVDISTFEEKLSSNSQMTIEEVKRLTKLFSSAVYFRQNKKFTKGVTDLITVNPFIILFFVSPFLIPLLFAEQDFSFWFFVLIYIISYLLTFLGLYLIISITKFVTNFEFRIGKILTRFFRILLILLICSTIYIPPLVTMSFFKWAIYASVFLIYTFIILKLIDYLLSVLTDIFFFSKKIQITDALIIESSFQLTTINWADAIKKRSKRQDAINEVERLANLIEYDWSAHIKAKDDKNTKWKNDTLMGIAEGIRSLKKKIMVPNTGSSIYLTTTFESIFQKVLTHDILSLVGAEVPATRIRKKSKYKIIKSLLVAIVPISIAIALKLYPIMDISENYINIAIVVAILWLLLSGLLWLDPNLADKIATLKSARGLMKSNNDDE
jgi:hypothetical protein